MLKTSSAIWHCGAWQFDLSRPRIMGILNVTPDSFSDGGSYVDVDAAIAHGVALIEAGADLIDVGGESTRPGHTPVTPDEEARRVVPVVRGLVERGIPVSIDTRHADVARMCVRLGAVVVNDVEGFRDPAMQEVAVETDCGCLVMYWQHDEMPEAHARKQVTLDLSRPVSPQPQRPLPSQRRFTLPEEAPIMRKVMGFLGDQARLLQRKGVARERLCIDPGPGFDKTVDEDVVIQRAFPSLVSLGYPVASAVSRKRFVGALAQIQQAEDRDVATVGVCLAALEAGARILRVHNVQAAFEAVQTYWAMRVSDPRQTFVALGSNQGDSQAVLAEALRRMDALPLTCVVQVSHLYESEPAYGLTDPVINAVAELRCELHPRVLMKKLLELETALGRVRKNDNTVGPRAIDLDLIWMQGERATGQSLTLPHPRFHERAFVIEPLYDLMHDPVRFFAHEGIALAPAEARVGTIRTDLGACTWES